MALRTDTPIVVQQFNVWTIRSLELIMPEGELPTMLLTIASGYDTGDELVSWVREDRITVPGDVVAATWLQPPSAATIYESVKASLYGWLLATGMIPAGATEHEYIPQRNDDTDPELGAPATSGFALHLRSSAG